MRNGSYKITSYEVTNRYEPEKTLAVEKFNPKKPISAIYVDGESKQYMVKRFMIETSTADKEFGFISESIGSRLVLVTTSETPEVEMEVVKGKDKEKLVETINLEDIIDVKGWKALGNRLTQLDLTGKVSEVTPEVKLDKKKTSEVKMGTTIELDVNPKAGKKGKQGDLF